MVYFSIIILTVNSYNTEQNKIVRLPNTLGNCKNRLK